MFGALISGLWKGTKVIATGKAQSSLGMQSPQLPGAVVRLGRFFYITSGTWLAIVWYSGYANMRTAPGGGPRLVMPGTRVVGGPNRSLPDAKWAQTSGNNTSDSIGAAKFVPGGQAAGGFLPKGSKYAPGRHDQGRDGQTSPGGPIVSPGFGIVLRIGSDPSGFGPDYPIVHFYSGPYAGKDIYIGHTHAALRAGARFRAGEVLSYTGKTPVGNATVPGWFEIGFAPGGSPGPLGQPAPF